MEGTEKNKMFKKKNQNNDATLESRRHSTNLDIEDFLRLETSIMEVKVLVPSPERSIELRMIKQLRSRLPKLVSRITRPKHRVRQVYLLLHKFLHFLRVWIFKPDQKNQTATHFLSNIFSLSKQKKKNHTRC